MVCRGLLVRILVIPALALTAMLIVWGCSGTDGCGCGLEPEELLYSNSFEAAADTVGWAGYGGIWIADEAAPGGGSQALGVSGGCIWPHAEYTLEPLPAGCRYTVRCWAKLVDGPGTVQLRVAGEYDEEVRLAVESSEWTLCETTESIWCPAGQSLEVSASSGGFRQPGGILIDLVEVVRPK